MDTAQAAPRRVAPPPRPSMRWSRIRHPYAVFSAAAVIAAVILAIRRPWGVDFWVHVTAVERLTRDLVEPGDLQAAGSGPESSYYTPYTVCAAVLARLAGLSAPATLSWLSVAWCALLCWAFFGFARLIGAQRRFPVVAAAVVLTLWGKDMWAWSGFLQVFSLPVTLPLPSTLASALMFATWTVLVRVLARPQVWRFVVLAVLAALIVLIHPLTALNTAVGAIGVLIWRGDVAGWRAWAGLAASTLGAAALAAAWPYFPVFALAGSRAIDGSHGVLYGSLVSYEGLFLLAVPALWWRWRADRRDVLVWTTFLGLAIFAVSGLTGQYTYARVLTVVMVGAQLAVAAVLVESSGVIRRIWRGLVITACATSLVVNSGNLWYLLPPSPAVDGLQRTIGRNPVPPEYDWLSTAVNTNDVVITNDRLARRTITAHGVYTVAPGWPDPVAVDRPDRADAVEEFFAPATPARVRDETIRRYEVDWVLYVPPGRAVGDFGAPDVVGPDGQRLYRVTAS